MDNTERLDIAKQELQRLERQRYVLELDIKKLTLVAASIPDSDAPQALRQREREAAAVDIAIKAVRDEIAALEPAGG